MLLSNLVAQYRANRRILLLIVYVALFLDNMLLTTVGKAFKTNEILLVPIIPEYLLRISHPNSTDMLLHHKIPKNPNLYASVASNSRQKQRQKRVTPLAKIDWDSAKWENDYDTSTTQIKVLFNF